jgi:formate dehydrogenase maturation protein FdhE
MAAWRGARVYRCSRCHTEWAVAPQDTPEPSQNGK